MGGEGGGVMRPNARDWEEGHDHAPPKVSPQFPFAPGALIRFHIPGCTGARGYINDDGMLAIVGAEKEEDDEPHQ